MTWAINEGYMPDELESRITCFAFRVILLFGAKALVAIRWRTRRALVKLSISVPQLNCDVSALLFFMSHSLFKE